MITPLLTGPQAICCALRALGCTYRQVRAGAARFYNLEVRSDEALESCFRKSALCLPWAPGCQGGAEPYLSPWEEHRLCAEIRHGADELASCPTDYILNHAQDLKIQRIKLAIQFLLSLNCPRLAESLEFPSSPPTPSWLADFARRHSLKIRCCEKLDSVRRKFCDQATIWNWFWRNSQVLQFYNRDLILNMDETGLSTNRKFRVVVPDGMFPIVAEERKEIHLTGVVTFSSNGRLFRPGVILPGLKNLPVELQNMTTTCDFYTSQNGWMTKRVFDAFCVNLAHEVALWRLELPSNLRNQRILLIVDGHGSRKSAFGICYLLTHGIDVLIFPGHSTHVMQPFDVAVAAPMKGQLLKEIQKRERWLAEGRISAASATGARRYILTESFSEAIRKSATPCACQNAFHASGLRPIDVNVPLSSHLVLPHALEVHEEDWISGAYFSPTSPATLELLQREGLPNGIPSLTPSDMMARCGSAFLSSPRTLPTAVAILDFTTPRPA